MDYITSLDDFRSNKKSTLNVYQFDAKVALAFQTDCDNLLETFQKCQNLTFSAFARVWKNAIFLSIFKHQENILGIQAFLQNCFSIIKKYFTSSDLYLQTGAIYMLYGLYYKQPIKNWIKIRLTHSDLCKLEEIIEVHKSSKMLDPVFIYSKMRMDGAFEYCALPQPFGLEARHLKKIDVAKEELNIRSSSDSVLKKFKNLMEEDPDLVHFEETDEEYQKLSQKYKEKLFTFPSKIGDELKKAYSEAFQVNLEDKTQDDEWVNAMKKKAMMNRDATYRGERKIVTALDLQEASTSKES